MVGGRRESGKGEASHATHSTHLQHGDDDAGPLLERLGEHALEAVEHHGAVPALHCACVDENGGVTLGGSSVCGPFSCVCVWWDAPLKRKLFPTKAAPATPAPSRATRPSNASIAPHCLLFCLRVCQV